jgi:molecular chaperone Hsp33
MSESSAEPAGAEVITEFVRHRNVMLVQGDLGPLLVDYHLHLADHGLRPDPAHGALLRDLVVAFTLHCAARPRLEHLAWTLGLQDPRLNLFVTGDNEDCTVAGRLFTENVRVADRNLFFSDLLPRRGAEKRRSAAEFAGADIFRAAEAFYAASEQQVARFFDLGEDRHVLLLSHPDCDEAWLKGVDAAALRTLPETETVTRIERRRYRWNCGCDQAKILGALAPAAREDFAALFEGDESIHVQCPRCAAGHVVTREAMEAFLARGAGPGR